jgi:primosomal protein N''
MKLIQIVAVLASMASMASAIAIDPQGPVNAAELKGRVAGKFSNTLFTSRSNNIQRCVQEMNVQSHTQLLSVKPSTLLSLKAVSLVSFFDTLFTSDSNNIQRCAQEMNVQSHTQLPKEVSWPQMLGCASLANVTQTLKTKSQ